MKKSVLFFAFALGLSGVFLAGPAFAVETEETNAPVAAPEAAATTESVQFEGLKTHVDGTTFNVGLNYKGEIKEEALDVSYLGDTIQIEIPKAEFAKGKHLVRTNGRVVKSVYVYQPKAGLVRIRIALNNGYVASRTEDSLKISKADGSFGVSFNAQIDKASKGEKAKADYTHALNFDGTLAVADNLPKAAVSDEIIEQARLVAQSEEAGAKPANDVSAVTAAGLAVAKPIEATTEAQGLTVEQTKKMKESEIPLAPTKEQKKSESQPWQKMIVTLGVLAALLGGASFGLKKWNKNAKNKNSKATKIKVLTQHHLGPKKSVMIIQVAGESILLGVTDHNISMLKTLSFIDDEIPESLPNDFEGEISENFIEEAEEVAAASVRQDRLQKQNSRPMPKQTRAQSQAVADADREMDDFALRGLSDIRDKVSTRLKNMRTL